MTLSITDVFTPAPSGVGPNQPPSGSWLSSILQNATTVGLTTTSWQSGGVARTILAIDSNMLALEDVNASIMSQGGFLDFAATGTVTFTDPFTGAAITRYVTPDPSNAATWPIAGSVPFMGWLDLLADSVYNVQRIQATAATGTATFANATSVTSATYPPGQFHIASSNGATYTNTAALTIPANGTTTCTFQADTAGTAGNASPGQVATMVTSVVGVTVNNATAFAGGTNFESNTAMVVRCRAKVQSIATNGPQGAYSYWALSAFQFLQSFQGQVAAPMSLPITQAVVSTNPASGSVTVAVANSNGFGVGDGNPIVQGVAQLAVTGVTNASPIVLTVPSTSGLSVGMSVEVSGVQGNTAANGFWPIGTLTATSITLQGSNGTSSGAYTGGGIVEAGDLGLVDFVIQGNATPAAVTSTTISALAQYVTVRASVYVPAAQANSQLLNAIDAALKAYFASVPIGGFTSGVVTSGTLPFQAVADVIQSVSSSIRDVTLTLATGAGSPSTADVVIGVTSVPVVAYPGPSANPAAGITFVSF